MGTPRIEYGSDDSGHSVVREELFILIHYANTLNSEKARKLYFASETEYIYRRYNGLSTIGMDYYNSHHTYLNAADLYEVVNFLGEQVIPSLKNQTNPDLIETLGGWEYLKDEISNGASYKQRFGILNAENNAEETFQYIYIAESLKEIIEQSLSTGVPYEIHYNE